MATGIRVLIVATLAVTLFALCPEGIVDSSFPAWAIDLRARLSDFQTLIGGILALIAGAFAYVGLREQTATSREMMQQVQRHHEELMKDADTDRKNSQIARSANIALQMHNAISPIVSIVREMYALISIDIAEAYQRRASLEIIRREKVQLLRREIERFYEVSKWCRDPLLSVPPMSQRHLIKQIAYSFIDVRNIDGQIDELFLKDESGTLPGMMVAAWPSITGIESFRRNMVNLVSCDSLLNMIIEAGGKTNDAVIETFIVIQESERQVPLADYIDRPSTSTKS